METGKNNETTPNKTSRERVSESIAQGVMNTLEKARRQGNKRTNLLNLIFQRISKGKNKKTNQKTNKGNSNFTDEDLSRLLNHEFGDLIKFIKYNRKCNKPYLKYIRNLEDLKGFLFPFEVSDEQFYQFLLSSNEGNYQLDDITIQFGPIYENLKKQLAEKKEEIAKKEEELGKEYDHLYFLSQQQGCLLDNRRLPKSIDDLYESKKEMFIKGETGTLRREEYGLQIKIKQEQNKFYAEYPYLKPIESNKK